MTAKLFHSEQKVPFSPCLSPRRLFLSGPNPTLSATFFIDFSREAFTRPGEENRSGPGPGERARGCSALRALKKGEILTRSFMDRSQREKCCHFLTNGKLNIKFVIKYHVLTFCCLDCISIISLNASNQPRMDHCLES